MNQISPYLFFERPFALLRLHEALEQLRNLEVGVRGTPVVRLQGLHLLGQLQLTLLGRINLEFGNNFQLRYQ